MTDGVVHGCDILMGAGDDAGWVGLAISGRLPDGRCRLEISRAELAIVGPGGAIARIGYAHEASYEAIRALTEIGAVVWEPDEPFPDMITHVLDVVVVD